MDPVASAMAVPDRSHAKVRVTGAGAQVTLVAVRSDPTRAVPLIFGVGLAVNVGGLEPITHRDLVDLMIEVANTGRRRYVEWPAEKKVIDIGSFYADSTRFRALTGWEPTVTLREGLTRTIAFYREHLPRYL